MHFLAVLIVFGLSEVAQNNLEVAPLNGVLELPLSLIRLEPCVVGGICHFVTGQKNVSWIYIAMD